MKYLQTFKKEGLDGTVYIVEDAYHKIAPQPYLAVMAVCGDGHIDWPILLGNGLMIYTDRSRLSQHLKELIAQACEELAIIKALTRT